MRKLIFLVIFYSGFNFQGSAQYPNTQTQPGAGTETIANKPAPYASTISVNKITIWEASEPLATEGAVIATNRTLKEVKQTNQYFDGLGRPLQTVAKGVSVAGDGMVSPFEYDAYGRETLKYLPYVSTAHHDGTFKLVPFEEQEDFMSQFYNPNNSPAGEKYYYSQTNYEPSPLNRVTETFAPGNNWIGDAVGVSTDYYNNTITDQVRIWNISLASGSMPTTQNIYVAGTLTKTITTDENGKPGN